MKRFLPAGLAFVLGAVMLPPGAAAQEVYQATLVSVTPDSAQSDVTGSVRIAIRSSVAVYQLTIQGLPGVDWVAIYVERAGQPAWAVTLYDGAAEGSENALFVIGTFRGKDMTGMNWDEFTTGLSIGQAWVGVCTKQSPEGALVGRLVPAPPAAGKAPLISLSGTRGGF